MRPVARRLQVLLELPRPLQPGGGASVPGPGVVLSEGPAGPPEERRQPGLTAGLGPLVLLLTGESQVRPPPRPRYHGRRLHGYCKDYRFSFFRFGSVMDFQGRKMQ